MKITRFPGLYWRKFEFKDEVVFAIVYVLKRSGKSVHTGSGVYYLPKDEYVEARDVETLSDNDEWQEMKDFYDWDKRSIYKNIFAGRSAKF